MRLIRTAIGVAAAAVLATYALAEHSTAPDRSEKDADWPGYGRTDSNIHFSPLANINSSNVSRLGLAWWFDIPGFVLATSTPVAVGSRLYFTTGYSVVRAVDGATGRLLWTYDPHVSEVAGRKLHAAWGLRGIAAGNGKIYLGTHDGRLIAIDARSGTLVWSVRAVSNKDLSIVTGPPLVFKRSVLVGYGGADLGPMRGYVTAYDAETGKLLWRFFTVPGNPSLGLENRAMQMAARTWTGRWWKEGGGGTVWNAMTYDGELNRIYIGTSNGMPVNHERRSPGGGDNLFLASIVALDADSGAYIWHYQTNPAETWDFDATTDIELATLTFAGSEHRVLMQASKNGFFYVIDRGNGALISAEKFTKVTWALRIDSNTGRPVEVARARAQPETFRIWPSPYGAHGPQAMAFNPGTGFAYIPTLDLPSTGELALGKSSLVAWDPIRRRKVWQVALHGLWNGGVATTGGSLVFQGQSNGQFAAYAASTGKLVWSFDAHASIVGAPMVYNVGGREYVSVMVGPGGVGAALNAGQNARTQSRRLLAFSLDGQAKLPAESQEGEPARMFDPTFISDVGREKRGALLFDRCIQCHGSEAVGWGDAPDLRGSAAIRSAKTFGDIVRGGALLKEGMPRFDELTAAEAEDLRQYVRSRAAALLKAEGRHDAR